MTKDLQLKVRVDDADTKRLADLAEHYAAPAATVVRILIKEKHDALRAKGAFNKPTTKRRSDGKG